LQDNECEDCSLCSYPVTNPVITPVSISFQKKKTEKTDSQTTTNLDFFLSSVHIYSVNYVLKEL